MLHAMEKAYIASEFEAKIYDHWEKSGVFSPQGQGEPFCLVSPPPNANGNLHLGHALEIAIMDILTRYNRMRGKRALWIPGADHAGIETQVVFEKKLEKEDRSRFQMTREQFYQETLAFTLENKKNMEAQMRQLGASCDWTTERFTLDQPVVDRVYRTFKQLYDDGLIYRGERVVNYSVKYRTAYSDIEVIHEDRQDPLYYIKYGPITIATVRPETKFGEKYIVVHPDDKRYQQYIGQSFKATIATGEELEMRVIADEAIKPEFGTGAMTITPAHDPIDFEIAKRHNLPIEPIIGFDGKLLPIAGQFAGLKAIEARKQVVEKLQELGLIEKIDENYRHSVALCYKSLQPIEPMLMPQWFVKVRPLADRAIAALNNDEIVIYPESYKKVLIDWFENLRDWNISRQIWWGIPINKALPEVPEIAQDQDTFDTWFSSGQWPYATLEALGPAQFKEFYPNTVLQTGRDLIFSWVSRMIMFGLYVHNQVPFKQLYLHGMILDPQGKKMSKSKGNVVSPIELSARYGADALRFGLIIGSSAGGDIPLPEEKMVGGRNFANKLWNIARFVMMQMEEIPPIPDFAIVTEADKFLAEQTKQLIADLNSHLENYRFAQALQILHEFSWHQFADVYLETAKQQKNENTSAILYDTLQTILKLAHPFMPFVTEAIWQSLPNRESDLIVTAWPH